MAQLKNKIIEYIKANGINKINFLNDFILQNDGQGDFIKEWNLNIPKPNMDQLDVYEAQANVVEANAQVISNRKQAYGTIEQQIEFITENGIEAWQQKVQQIKTDNPKN